MSALTGIITDIQRFSLHDGPGIRTSVFLKGCNMRCLWCHNPETLSPQPQVLFDPARCIGCGLCEEGCFSGARELCGRTVTVEEVLREVEQDRPYYGSEGGITVTGGEPSCQWAFAAALLQACRAHGIHTAVECNGFGPFAHFEAIFAHCDLVMSDLKLFSDEAHRRWTGVSNQSILAYFRRLDTLGIPFVMRTPVVPGVNDTEAEIGAIAAFAATLQHLQYYELLPYHPLGLSKQILGSSFEQPRFERPTRETMQRLAACAAAHGIPIRIAAVDYTPEHQPQEEPTCL